MRVTRFLLPTLIAVIATATVVVGAGAGWRAQLSGRQEVPPVATLGKGEATFKLNMDGTALEYELYVSDTEPILQAHIHLGPAGQNGPVVAFLANFGPLD